MTDTTAETDSRVVGTAPADRPHGAAHRVAELEAENAALRRALARAGLDPEHAAGRQKDDLVDERAGRAAAAAACSSAAQAENTHGREIAAGGANPPGSDKENDALRRANADLASSRSVLREREERLRLILDSATEYAIFGTDLDRCVTSWNAGAERLLGWCEDEIVGRPADLIFTPEDRASGAPEGEMARALRDGRATNERWHLRKDGSRFWGSGLMMPLCDPKADPAAPPVGLLKVMRDRTAEREAERALHEAEDHLRHTVELNPQIPWTADPEGLVTGFSNRWLAATGLSCEDALGEGWTRVPHPEDRPRMEAAWVRAVSTGEPYDVQARLRMADGSHRWWRVRAFPRRDGEGRVVRWYGTTEDIHGCKAAEEALREGEARWRGLFERMHEGFALCEMVRGPDGRVADCRFVELNAAWEQHTGISRTAALGRLVTELVPPDEAAFWIGTYARVVETGEPARVERHTPSLRRWFEATIYATEPGRAATLLAETTDLRAAEARRDALVELGDRLRDLRDPGEIAHAAAEVIGRALGASRAGYGAVDREEIHRVERDWTGGPEVASVAGEWRLPKYWTGFADDLRRGEAVVVRDTARDPRSAGAADAYAAVGVRAQVVVPVLEAGRVVALLFVHHAAPRAWTDEEVAFIRGAADRAWAAAERARSEEALRRSESHRRAALDAARLGTWEWDLETGAVTLCGRSREIFGFRPGEGATAPEVFDRIHPDDRPRVHAASMAAAAALLRLDIEYLVCLPEGGTRAVASLGVSVPGADGRAARMVGVFADITDRNRAEQQRALLVNEVNHRAKNALAVVQAMLRLTTADNVPTFVKAVEGRVAALARAHTLLARQQWSGSSLHDLVRGELAPFMAGRATIDGPAVTLPSAAAQPVAMAVHELATNAAKHGALSAEAGTVAVAWRVEGRDLRIRWTERGGPPVDGAPERSGFGSRLLDGTIRTQLRGSVERTWDASGLVCDVVVPLEKAQGNADRTDGSGGAASDRTA